MPYIKLHERRELNKDLDPLIHRIDTAGKLAYVLYRLVVAYGVDGSQMCYARFAETLGVLDTTARELWQQHVLPYECTKRRENGDV